MAKILKKYKWISHLHHVRFIFELRDQRYFILWTSIFGLSEQSKPILDQCGIAECHECLISLVFNVIFRKSICHIWNIESVLMIRIVFCRPCLRNWEKPQELWIPSLNHKLKIWETPKENTATFSDLPEL